MQYHQTTSIRRKRNSQQVKQMIDTAIRNTIDPWLDAVSKRAYRPWLHANHITVVGFSIGTVGCTAIILHWYLVGLGCLLLNRIFDGLDGSYARTHQQQSDWGGFLDIVLDFIWYAAFAASFAVGELSNTLVDSVTVIAIVYMVVSFVGTGTTFLAFSIIAAQNKIDVVGSEDKSIAYITNGPTEGFETILVLGAMCLFPKYIVWLTLGYGSLCWLTTIMRIISTRSRLFAVSVRE